MPTFLIDVHMADLDALGFERAARMLVAAQARIGVSRPLTRTVVADLRREDGRLVCRIEADSLESARRLVRLALLPPARIREIGEVADDALLAGRHPGRDVHPGAEPELVEDVVDMRLDGPLGQE
jgi:hypothetical protein